MKNKTYDNRAMEKILVKKGVNRKGAYACMRRAVLRGTYSENGIILAYKGNNIFEIKEGESNE